jgi:DNA-binding NtrC family response regulator
MQRLKQKPVVLLVDELREYRQEAEKWLLQMGLWVESAASGFEALQRLSLAPVNLVIIHLNLPLMSGVDVVRQINRMKARMPVILY